MVPSGPDIASGVTTDARFEAYETLPLALGVFHKGNIRYVNPAWSRLFGITPEQAVGKSSDWAVTTLVAAEDRSNAQHLQHHVPPESPAEPHFILLTTPQSPDGHLFQVLSVRGPERGEVTVTLVDHTTPTSARLNAALIATTRALLACRSEADVMQTATRAIRERGYFVSAFVKEPKGFRIVVMATDDVLMEGLVAIAGHSYVGALVPDNRVPGLEEIFSDRRAKYHPDVHDTIRNSFPPEYLALYRTHYPVHRGLSVPIYVGGEPYGFLSMNHANLSPDLITSFQLYADLIGSAVENVRHHQNAASRLKRLHGLQQELVQRERLAAVGEAAAVMAHEVRNPLGSILNCVSLLRINPPGSELAPALFEMLEEESLRLERLVRHLLDFTRPMEPQVEDVAVAPLVELAFRAIGGGAEKLKHLLHHQVSNDLRVPADRTLLQMALENLVRNATQASPPGSRVVVSAERVDGTLWLRVSDSGPGIPEVDRERIFEPFVTTRASGSGLGLALVKRVAELHGGVVRVGAQNPYGATLELGLPAVRTPPEAN